MENWKSIAGYEGLYEVSDLGRVRSLKYGKEKIMKPCNNTCGYLFVKLHKAGKSKHMFVHRLVAQAFISNPQGLATVNHKDENKHNNAAFNLEWMSHKDNTTYSQGRQVQQFDKQGNLLATFRSAHEAERVTRIDHNCICWCCLGKQKSAGGFIWRYA